MLSEQLVSAVSRGEVPDAKAVGILVVDDLQDNRELLCALLNAEGFGNIHSRDSGEAALDCLAEHDDIGLVLLDIMMPGIDGYEVCERMQANEVWREIPVIMVTGGGLTANQALQKSFQVGATDYVSKPINEVELFSRMSMALTLYQERLYRHLQTARLRESEEQFRLTFDMAPVGIAHVDLEGRILHANQSLEQLLDYPANEIRNAAINHFLAPGESLRWHDVVGEYQRGGRPEVEKEVRFSTREGDELWVNLAVSLLEDSAGEPCYYITTLEDVTDRKRAHQEMERIAFHDPLTGLANRRLFNKLLADSIKEAGKQDRELAVFFLDLDHFKQVNDTLGHAAGDRLLQQASLRIGDCLDDGSVLSRLGGDEFAILMTRGASEDGVCALAQRIVDSFSGSLAVEGHDIIVTPSIGISRFPADGATPEQLTKNADAAMYKTKEAGRNGYRVYNPAMTFHVAERMSLEQSLRRAEERGELRIFYQPQCLVETGEMVAAEVLVRWEHPEQGLLPPERFIPLAEDTGLISELGEWVFSNACQQIKDWQTQGVRLVPVMVNLSMMQMRTDDIVPLIRKVLMESGVDPALIGVELTENIASLDGEMVIGMLNQLRGDGVKVVMDDFGSGYSSLNRLRHFPLDGVKIDKSFIVDVPSNSVDVAIIESMISLARTLELSVVAEGVETTGQLELLRKISCDVAQGFLFGRAMPAEEFAGLLENRDKAGRVYPAAHVVG